MTTNVKHRIITDETGRAIAGALQAIAHGYVGDMDDDYAAIQRIVRDGLADQVYGIGDQLVIPWTDDANKTWDMPFDVVAFRDVTLSSGETVPGMWLQAHYALPFGTQFDKEEAFYKVPAGGLAAGTYYLEMTETWSKAVAGNYQFTLANAVPAGGVLCGFNQLADNAPSTWKVTSYASNASTEAIETVSVTSGSGGTKLGTFCKAGSTGVNSTQRVGYGYNRWSQSGLRQFLNSDKAAGAWWAAANDFDRAPSYASKSGFMRGFPEAFRSILGEVKVDTLTNTVTDGGVTDTTYDRFFLPSLAEHHIAPQATGEGTAWPYWQRALGESTPAAQYSTKPRFITYGLDAKTSPRGVFQRSANRGYAPNVWYVYASGSVGNLNAYSGYYAAPACVIC